MYIVLCRCNLLTEINQSSSGIKFHLWILSSADLVHLRNLSICWLDPTACKETQVVYMDTDNERSITNKALFFFGICPVNCISSLNRGKI